MDRSAARRTLRDFPEIADCLEAFTDTDLDQIPVVPPGTSLKPGAVYLDLCRSDRAAYHALPGATAPETGCVISQDGVPEALWTRLIGVNNPECQSDEPTG